MALTQITTGGIKDLTITTADIAADAINNAKLANNAVTADQLPTGTVSESLLNISNAGTNGQYLQKQSGNTGGLTWADVPAGVGGGTGLDVNDNVKIRLGTGNDLEIFHDGGDSAINNTTGNIYIQNAGSNTDSDIYIRAKVGNDSIVCKDDAEVELYYDNSKKLETLSNGVRVTGQVDVNGGGISLEDSRQLLFGAGDDLQISHDGSVNIINSATANLELRHGSEKLAAFAAHGQAELYYDNSKKLETYGNGVKLTERLWVAGGGHVYLDDASHLHIGSGDDLRIYHDGTYTWSLDASTGGWHSKSSKFVWQAYDDAENMAIFHQDGACRFWYDGSEKLATKSDGVLISGELQTTTLDVNGNSHLDGSLTLTASIYQADNDVHFFGSSNDLEIFHDGSNSYIRDVGTGNLIIRGQHLQIQGANGENMVYANQDGSVELYHNATKKLETTSAGVTVNGNLTVTGSGGGLFSSYAVLMDTKSHGTQGQNLSTDDWFHRDLTSEYFDPDGIVSLADDDFTLGAGTYFIRWNSLFHRTKSVKTRLKNHTDGTVVKSSMNSYPQGTSNTSWTAANSHGMARTTFSGTKIFRIEYFADTDYSNVGGGYLGPTDSDNTEEEIYTQVEIWKES